MPGPAVKIAVSVPEDLFEAVETERKKEEKNRSTVVQEALRDWLRNRAYAGLVREYQAGYAAKPESVDEIEAAMHVALGTLADDEDW